MSQQQLPIRIYLAGSAVLAALSIGWLGTLGPSTGPAAAPSEASRVHGLAEAAPSGQAPVVSVLARADAALAAAHRQLNAPLPSAPEAPIGPDSSQTWQLPSPEEAQKLQPNLPLSEQIKTYSPVKINSNPSPFPEEGDKLNLPMFNGRTLIAQVESVKVLENGDRVWTGFLEGYGNDFPVVMTYGETLTFATIHTPEGSYALEAKEGVGWLYKNPSIVELSGPNYVDALIPTH